MYIDQGNILEKGTHDELMAKDGYYKELYMSQYAFWKKCDIILWYDLHFLEVLYNEKYSKNKK